MCSRCKARTFVFPCYWDGEWVCRKCAALIAYAFDMFDDWPEDGRLDRGQGQPSTST